MRWSPSRLVPVLWRGEQSVWDTLAIAEYLAERYPEWGCSPAGDSQVTVFVGETNGPSRASDLLVVAADLSKLRQARFHLTAEKRPHVVFAPHGFDDDDQFRLV